MVKIYVGQGCVRCHKAVNKLLDYVGDAYIERDDKAVSEVMAKTFGIVPIFEHNGKFYNEYQISNMIDAKFDFNEAVKTEVTIEEPKITNKK